MTCTHLCIVIDLISFPVCCITSLLIAQSRIIATFATIAGTFLASATEIVSMVNVTGVKETLHSPESLQVHSNQW